MKVTIMPSAARGTMEAPPSKSMAHRLLICAGLAEGTSVIENVDLSRDIEATMQCLRALGADMSVENGCVTVRGMGAAGLRGRRKHPVLPCGESGSTLRFMIPLCLLGGPAVRLSGSSTLLSRPLAVYEKICREQGLVFERGQKELLVEGRLAPGQYLLPGDVSSQFVSGLLFALPLLEGESTLRLLPPVESRPYIDMTLQALHQFGIQAWWAASEPLLHIPGGQCFRPQRGLRVEGDYSNAAFFQALGMLGGEVRIEGLKEDSLQGDRVCTGHLEKLRQGFAAVDLSDCPDLGPVLMAFAAARHGARFTGTRRLQIKESDRGKAMRQELAKMGVRVEIHDNEILVSSGLQAPRDALYGHNDHRIVMALSVLLTQTGGSIEGAEAVAKSLPDFFDRLRQLGIQMTCEGGPHG